MGWLYHFSGLQEVTRDLAMIKEKYPKIKLLIVGDGDAYEDLKKLREELHLEDRMILAGKQPFNKVPEFIAAADICLLPAHDNEIMHDIVPIKMYEYMAMGKPIVATKLYGVMTEFGEKHGLLYVDSSDRVMAEVLRIINSSEISSVGNEAKKFVEHNRWDDITTNFEKTLEGLICQ